MPGCEIPKSISTSTRAKSTWIDSFGVISLTLSVDKQVSGVKHTQTIPICFQGRGRPGTIRQTHVSKFPGSQILVQNCKNLRFKTDRNR